MENHWIYTWHLSKPWWWNQPASTVNQIWSCALSYMYVRVTIYMLTLRWLVSRLRQRIPCCHLFKTAYHWRLNGTYVRYPCPTRIYLTKDVWSHQFEQCHSRYSMDRLYKPKNLWVNHSTRLRYVQLDTPLFSAGRDARSQAQKCNRIQTNCSLFSSPFVPSYPIIIDSHTLL